MSDTAGPVDLIEARAPGRVNLIGDHTDYTGGLALPLAIDRHTVVRGRRVDSPSIELTSHQDPAPTSISLPVATISGIEPEWARIVAAIARVLEQREGFTGTIDTTIPIGAGLSSSAALEVALLLALDRSGDRPPVAAAGLCQEAEREATGTPTGIMDQLTSLAGLAGHALLLDCHLLEIEPVPLPAEADVVVRLIEQRKVSGSGYSDRVSACARVEAEIGPLRLAALSDLSSLTDPVLRARARHVITENRRVKACAAALRAGDLAEAGSLMSESHASLRDDYEVSTPQLDDAASAITSKPGVYGARLTGAGFGGCVVALTQPGAIRDGWVVRAVDGASVRPVR